MQALKCRMHRGSFNKICQWFDIYWQCLSVVDSSEHISIDPLKVVNGYKFAEMNSLTGTKFCHDPFIYHEDHTIGADNTPSSLFHLLPSKPRPSEIDASAGTGSIQRNLWPQEAGLKRNEKSTRHASPGLFIDDDAHHDNIWFKDHICFAV